MIRYLLFNSLLITGIKDERKYTFNVMFFFVSCSFLRNRHFANFVCCVLCISKRSAVYAAVYAAVSFDVNGTWEVLCRYGKLHSKIQDALKGRC